MRKRLRVDFHNFDHNVATPAFACRFFPTAIRHSVSPATPARGAGMVNADVCGARWHRRKKMRFLLTSAFAVTLAYLELERPSSNDPTCLTQPG